MPMAMCPWASLATGTGPARAVTPGSRGAQPCWSLTRPRRDAFRHPLRIAMCPRLSHPRPRTRTRMATATATKARGPTRTARDVGFKDKEVDPGAAVECLSSCPKVPLCCKGPTTKKLNRANSIFHIHQLRFPPILSKKS